MGTRLADIPRNADPAAINETIAHAPLLAHRRGGHVVIMDAP
jgi:hypothetical protein